MKPFVRQLTPKLQLGEMFLCRRDWWIKRRLRGEWSCPSTPLFWSYSHHKLSLPWKCEFTFSWASLSLKIPFVIKKTSTTLECEILKSWNLEISLRVPFFDRDHLLHDWFELLSTCPATTNMYDTPSFFRDTTLVQFLVDLLQTLMEFNITLEASLLKGIS